MSAREAVLARNAEMYKKFNKGDLDGVSAAYTEKAVLYEHGENPVVGRQAIKASLGKLASTVKTMELEKLEFFEQFNDNTAYTLDFTKCLDSSGRTVARYKGALLWRKVGGTWLIDHDIFNDLPK